MRRLYAIGATALILVLALSFCCLAGAGGPSSSCCKGHCAMSSVSAPISAITPAKSVHPRPAVVAVTGANSRLVTEQRLPPQTDATFHGPRFDPIGIIQLRI